MTTPTGSDLTPVSGDAQPTATAGSGASTPEHFAELVLRVLDEEGAESAAALMRRMLSADQGILLERTSGDVRRELLPWLTLEEISDILYEAPTESAVVITRELTAERAADLLDDVDSHTVVDILQELSDQQASAIVEELERPEDVVALMQYPSDSAGGMMTPDSPHVRRDDTAGLALDALRVFGEDAEGFGWVCVLDNDRRLTGYVSIAQLALARPTRTAGELADEYDHRLVSISSETDQEEAHRIMSRYTLSLLPVVDAEQWVLGVIRAEEMMNVAAEEATEDML